MAEPGSLTIIVPAYNEESNLRGTVETVLDVLPGRIRDYEILIFDDCSTDGTPEISDELARGNPGIKAIHNEVNRGLGYNFTKGVQLASKEFVMLLHGDNETRKESVARIFELVGQADIIIPWTANTEVRPLKRRVLSRLFTALMNLLTGLRIKYYNGPCVHRSSLIKNTPMTTWGFAYMAAVLARLIRSGATYIETPMYLQRRDYGKSKAFKLKNLVSVSKTLAELFWEFRIIGTKPRGARTAPVRKQP
jgi:glycosyltransferase involved in cell wall biosynthesis